MRGPDYEFCAGRARTSMQAMGEKLVQSGGGGGGAGGGREVLMRCPSLALPLAFSTCLHVHG